MHWEPRARGLAEQVTHPRSRWRAAVAATPRHLFVPAWWEATPGGWQCTAGSGDLERWADAAYAGRSSLVTRVDAVHADDAPAGTVVRGRPTSSATMPALTVQMFSHLRVYEGARVLDCGTGSGYGTALLCRVLGADDVVSVDVDGDLTAKAAARLAEAGLVPRVTTADGTGELPDGGFDRLVATFSVQAVPPGWLTALNTGGRFVTTIAGTSMILTAYKTADGGADGQIERDWAAFMPARREPAYPPGLIDARLGELRDAEGDDVGAGRHPVLDIGNAWELMTMLQLTVPGVEHHFETADHDGAAVRTAYLAHPSGSWARAVQHGDGPPEIHQSGERRLWDAVDELRDRWLRDGHFPVYGSRARVDPDGTVHLTRGSWRARLDHAAGAVNGSGSGRGRGGAAAGR